MKVIVMGAGVIGDTIAYYLVKQGVEVVRNCNGDAYRINKGRTERVSNYSRDVMPI